MNRLEPRLVRHRKAAIQLSPLAIGLAAAALLATSCVLGYHPRPLTSVAPTEQVALDATATASFSEQVGTIDDMNHFLTVERIGAVAIKGFPTPSPNDISVLVLNHATEPIRFADIGFGIEVFQFDAANKRWHRVRLPYTPEQRAKTIPPRLETYDFGVLNGWDISKEDLSGVTSSMIRIFVTGTGVETNRRYGAFLDVQLQSGQIQSRAGSGFF